jgi:hypothetical protein
MSRIDSLTQIRVRLTHATTRVSPTSLERIRQAWAGVPMHCRDMWRHGSHMLPPLTSLTSTNVPWRWGAEQSEAFKEVKKILSKEVPLAFPVFNKTFTMHMDASHRQLGAVISQDNHPMAFAVEN